MQRLWPTLSSMWVIAFWGIALGCASASAADIVRSGRHLSDRETRLVRVPDAPDTRLAPENMASGLNRSSTESSLKPAVGPVTVLRQAEIPPDRLARTRELLVELRAQATPTQAISIDLPADVLFDFDKHELRADAAPSLAKAAELIKSYPHAPIVVRGHTDGKGSDAYNDALSDRRAQSVAQELQSRTGRNAATLGLGRREPVAPNLAPDGKDNPAGRQLNRRVQILIEPAPAKGG